MSAVSGLFIVKLTATIAVNTYFYKLLVGTARFMLLSINGIDRRI